MHQEGQEHWTRIKLSRPLDIYQTAAGLYDHAPEFRKDMSMHQEGNDHWTSIKVSRPLDVNQTAAGLYDHAPGTNIACTRMDKSIGPL